MRRIAIKSCDIGFLQSDRASGPRETLGFLPDSRPALRMCWLQSAYVRDRTSLQASSRPYASATTNSTLEGVVARACSRKPIFISRPTTRPGRANALAQQPYDPAWSAANVETRPALTHSNQFEHALGIRYHGGALNMQALNFPTT